MSFEFHAKRALQRLRGATLVAAALAVGAATMVIGGSAQAQQKSVDSYVFAGLSWGMKAKDARAVLQRSNFRVAHESAGKQKEFAVDHLHAVYATIDRGKRLTAYGTHEGIPVTVELAFGKNDSLNHVYILSRHWDGTIKGARTMIDNAEKVVKAYEAKFGIAKKRLDDRWPDTAYWGAAKDGSTLTVHVRGVNGFMFSPSYRTAMRIDYANPKLNNGQVLGVKVNLNAGGWTDGPGGYPAYAPASNALAPARSSRADDSYGTR